MKPYLVDVPVRINIWIRPDCQRKQFEIIKMARPSIIFLQSDGGRTDGEWEAIYNNRKIYDEEVDWECEIHKIYEEHNLGIYAMGNKVAEYIWEHVDRCIFLEDDQIPSVTFFRFCSELLEKYKDDERIEMICGNNVLESYREAEPYDYFFTEVGWSIWGIATWKRTIVSREFPFAYADNDYIKKSLQENMTPFWYKKAKHYCNGELYENHVPGSEYFHMANSILYHRLSIVPTYNMICNVGEEGTHSKNDKKYWIKNPPIFNLKTWEADFPIKHPAYVIDDKYFGKLYEKLLRHEERPLIIVFFRNGVRAIDLLIHGGLIKAIQRRRKGNIET